MIKKKFNKLFLLLFLTATAGFQWSCEKDTLAPQFITAAKNPAIPANLFALVQSYGCAGCHNPTPGSYSFEDRTTAQNCYQSWVGVAAVIADCPGTRVVKGDAVDSVLIKRLEGTCSPQMPYGGPYMSAGEIQQFKDWINQGAKPE